MGAASSLLPRSPDACVLLLTLGLALIYLELNRPGSILPGATGLLAVLLSIAGFARFQLDPLSVALLLVAFAVLLTGLRRQMSSFLAALGTLILTFGLLRIVTGPHNQRVHPLTAISCGLLIGAGTSILTRIAKRARTNKGLD